MSKTLSTLLAAIINRAIDDLKRIGPHCCKIETDRVIAFILSDTCKTYCLEPGINYDAVREKAAEIRRKGGLCI